VIAQTLDKLADPVAFPGLRAAFTRDAADAGEPRDTEVIADLNAARARIAVWPLDVDGGRDGFRPGFERVYRRGRKALRAARDEPSDEGFHELRKRAKDLWHAAEILRPADPKGMRKLAKRAHALSDLTGDDHDLAVLLANAREHDEELTPPEREHLESLVAARRAKLQRKALDLGGRIYSRKPRKAARRVAKA
jgi:CHAD domain-containing protein